MKLRYIVLLVLAAAITVALLWGTRPPPKNREIKVFTWTHYLPTDVVRDFTAETGIAVNIDYYSSNEELHDRVRRTKADPGLGAYDVCIPSDYMLQKMAREGLLKTIRADALTHYAELDPAILAKAAETYDPGNRYGVPYMWGTVGIGFDSRYVQQPTIQHLLDPQFQNRVSIIDDPRYVIGTILKSQGSSVNSTVPRDLATAEGFLGKIWPNLLSVDSERYISQMEESRAWICIGFNGDVLQAAIANKYVKYVVPDAGSVLFVDSLALPANSQRPDDAHAFIDFLCRPNIAGRITNHIHYATANRGARTRFVDPAIRDNPAIFPPAEVLHRCDPLQDISDAEAVFDIWRRLKQ